MANIDRAMMLNAVTPQRHHQQTGAGNPLTLDAASSSSVATSPSSSSSSSTSSSASSSSSSSTLSSATSPSTPATNHTDLVQNQQQTHNLNNDPGINSQTSKSANVSSPAPETTTPEATTTTTTLKMKMTTTTTTADTKITEAATTIASSSSSDTQTITTNTNKLSPVTQTKTTNSHHQSLQHNQNHYQHNSYQSSPRYNHHSHQDSHHNNNNYNMSYAARSSNNSNQRGHNSNHNHHHHHHNNHNHNQHNHHHHNHQQNHSHHQHQHHNQQQQHQQQPIDNSNLAVSSSSSAQTTTETTSPTATTSNPAQRHQPASNGPPYYVDLHVNAGECVSLQLLDGQEQVVAGPATITMISQQQNPPVPIPVQVPPGHMIHQIADENGTLKHIILSIMNSTEDGSQLDSTVITLPKGTFRIDSHGELVSTDGSDGVPLTTLPQQAYFANYDGCPTVAYDATTLPDSIETATPATTMIGQALVIHDDYQNYHQSQATPAASAAAETLIAIPTNNDKSEQEQIAIECNPIAEYVQTSSTFINKPPSMTNHHHHETKTGAEADQTCSSTEKHNDDGQQLTNMANVVASSAVVPETDHQLIVEGSISDTTAYSAHQMLGTEMNLMNGSMPPMLPAAIDGQLYGYPPPLPGAATDSAAPCCCCCYCDPQEAAAAASANGSEQPAPLALAGQPDVILAPEHATGTGSTGTGRMPGTNRGSTATGTGGVLAAYQNPMLAPIQGNVALPLGVPPLQQPPAAVVKHGQQQPAIGPIVGGNHHLADSLGNQKMHGHPGGKGMARGSGGYKQHHKMMMSGNVSNSQSGYAGGHYNQSYNNIVAGGHHQHQHYKQTAGESSFKSQTLLPNQATGSGGGGYLPVYSNYDSAPTNISANVSSKPPAQHGNHHHNNHNNHHHQHQQSMGTNFRINNSNSDCDNFMQRTREQAGGYNYGPLAQQQQQQQPPPTTTVSSGGIRQQQHNSNSEGNNKNRHQTLGDKHNSRYTSANIKVISNTNNNSQGTGSGNPTQQASSVSPISSARVKTSGGGGGSLSSGPGHHYHNSNINHQHHQHNNHNNHHQSNHSSRGYSNSGSGGLAMQQIHETSNMNFPATTTTNNASFRAASPSSSSPRDSSTNNHKSNSKANFHSTPPYDHQDAPISKHINNNAPSASNNYLSQSSGNNSSHKQVPAWQHNKFNSVVSKNNTIHASHASDSNDQASRVGENNSILISPTAKNHSSNEKKMATTTMMATDSVRRQKAPDSSESGPRSSSKASGEQPQVADKSEDSCNSSRTSRGKQKKSQNQQQQINSTSKTATGNEITNSRKNARGTEESPSLAAGSDMIKISDRTAGIRVSSGSSPMAAAAAGARSDSKSSQTTTTGETTRSTPKPQQKNQASQKRKDKSSTQMNHQPAPIDKSTGSSGKIPDTKRAAAELADPLETAAEVMKGRDGEMVSLKTQKMDVGDKEIAMTIPQVATSKASESDELGPIGSQELSDSAAGDTQLKVDELQQQQQVAKHKNKHNGPTLSDSPVRKQESKRLSGQSESSSSPLRASKVDKATTPADSTTTIECSTNPESRTNDEPENGGDNDDDMLLLVSYSPTPQVSEAAGAATRQTNRNQAASTIAITMRTSLSENNIRSLETTTTNSGSSYKSTQTTPQKFMSPASSGNTLDAEGANNTFEGKTGTAAPATSTISPPIATSCEISPQLLSSKKRGGSASVSGDKRRGSVGPKLSSLPQLRLLNLNCTSVTSSSVQLRWSYVPQMAEKYGIHQYQHHHHHHSGSFKNPALMDHFVIESSSCKNSETNTLVSPKIVYQGCALTCRINQLSSEKIYHFKVRRTALLTTTSPKAPDAGSSGEHLVVSEILSVTLPSVQQHHQSSNSSQQHSNRKETTGSSRTLNNGNQAALFNDATAMTISATAAASSSSSSSTSSLSSMPGTNHRFNNNSTSHNNHSNSSGGSNNSKASQQHQVKFANLFKQCRTKFVTLLGKVVRNSLSSCSDTKFASLLLIVFTMFAMLLAIFIHYYIVTPVTE